MGDYAVELGQLGLAGLSATDRPYDWRLGIAEEKAMESPLTALLSAMEDEETTDPLFYHKEEVDEVFKGFAIGVYSAGHTILKIGDGAGNNKAKVFKKNDIIRNMTTLEYMKVVSDPTTASQLVVSRGFAGTTASAIANNQALVFMGTAWGQGQTGATAQWRKPTDIFNYCQIFKEAAEIDGTTLKTATRLGDLWRQQIRQALSRISDGMERAFFFGKRASTTDSDGKTLYLTGGLEYFVTTNVKDVAADNNGDITESLFEQYLEDMFRYGNQTKIAFVGSTALRCLNQLVKNKTLITVSPGATFYGFNFDKWITPQGTLLVGKHSLLTRLTEFRSFMFIVDLPALKYKYVRGRDLQLHPNIENNDVDGRKDEFLAECGLQLLCEKRHGIIKGITGVA